MSHVQYGVALHGMPTQVPVCTTTFLPGGGIAQSTWSAALPCTIRLHPYGVPQPCNLQQVTMHPLLSHHAHHSALSMPGNTMLSQPPVQSQFVPTSLNLQVRENRMFLIFILVSRCFKTEFSLANYTCLCRVHERSTSIRLCQSITSFTTTPTLLLITCHRPLPCPQRLLLTFTFQLTPMPV